MILQIKNESTHDQPITLHTGEAKTIESGVAIKVNTGKDFRLINYYASLVNYEFEVTALEASGQELNRLEDALSKIGVVKSTAESNKVLESNKVYPEIIEVVSDIPVEPRVPYSPKTLDDKVKSNEPIKSIVKPEGMTNVPKVVLDSKSGLNEIESITDEDSCQDDTVEVEAEVEVPSQEIIDEVEESENITTSEVETPEVADDKYSSDAKWYKLDELDDETLKLVLTEKFNESNTKLRSKSRIIYHIIELADAANIDVYKLVDEYK